MKKVCNQFFVKDIYRNKKYTATIRCSCCDEISNYEKPYPIELKHYMKWIDAFSNLHSKKGCNLSNVNAGEWAATEVSLGLVADINASQSNDN